MGNIVHGTVGTAYIVHFCKINYVCIAHLQFSKLYTVELYNMLECECKLFNKSSHTGATENGTEMKYMSVYCMAVILLRYDIVKGPNRQSFINEFLYRYCSRSNPRKYLNRNNFEGNVRKRLIKFASTRKYLNLSCGIPQVLYFSQHRIL